MRTNYILIDYENVQPDSLAVLDAEHFQVLVFVGANQAKVPFEMAEAMQRLGPRARYVKIAGNGSNALDFHIAFYIGELQASDPNGYFHVISKDAGFDPLIQHLKARNVPVLRSKAIDHIPLLKTANSRTLLEKVDAVVADLQLRGASKPKTVKTLSNTMSALFCKALHDSELVELFAEMQRRGFVAVQDNKVSYTLPGADGSAAPCIRVAVQ